MRIKALVIRIIRQFLRDKRTLGMMVIAPIFILTLISLVFSSDQYEPVIGVIDVNDEVVMNFEEQNAVIMQYKKEEELIEALRNKEIDGYMQLGISPQITLEGSDPTVNQAVLKTVQMVLGGQVGGAKPVVTYYYGAEEMGIFDNTGPFLIGFFVFFFVFLIAGVSFLRERTSGTLEKLLSTPLRRWEIVVGYVIGFGLFTTVQSAIIVWFSIHVLDMMMFGSIGLVMLVTLVLSITALTLGTLLSTFARNEFQMIQFIPIVIVPQVFFSGLFNMDVMSPWLRSIGMVMPLTYGGEAMRDIMIRGKGIDEIAMNLLILLAFSMLFMFLNNFALKKHRNL
ncbi:ABC transporter permease [Halalkalibacter kiskunsagensis]|uniref:ABC transporter permease n=1 Tax=Halalkalibacter kiskunsagensis TaxID=1548599 RepID=A0ABV6KAP7_9BACI